MEKLHQVTHSGDEASKQTWFGVQSRASGNATRGLFWKNMEK